jgi:hypothetical protein
MPQPLTSLVPNVLNNPEYRFSISSGAASYGVPIPMFENVPEFAVWSMDVIAKWSAVELSTLRSVAVLCGGRSEPAFQHYIELRSNTSKIPAMLIIAKLAVNQEYIELIDRLRRFCNSCEKQRNAIAHHSWGFFLNKTDAVLLIDPKYLVVRTGAVDISHLSKLMVWSKKDFDALRQDIHDYGTCITLMKDLRRDRENHAEYACLIEDHLAARGF